VSGHHPLLVQLALAVVGEQRHISVRPQHGGDHGLGLDMQQVVLPACEHSTGIANADYAGRIDANSHAACTAERNM
jgi:hypothetical protein